MVFGIANANDLLNFIRQLDEIERKCLATDFAD